MMTEKSKIINIVPEVIEGDNMRIVEASIRPSGDQEASFIEDNQVESINDNRSE